MKKIFILFISLFMFITFIKAEDTDVTNTLSPNAKSAILIESTTGEIIYEFVCSLDKDTSMLKITHL